MGREFGASFVALKNMVVPASNAVVQTRDSISYI
jgi:hypothetical protein